MTTQTAKKRVSKKAIALQLTGVLLVMVFGLTLFGGQALKGNVNAAVSAMTEQIGKQVDANRDADYYSATDPRTVTPTTFSVEFPNFMHYVNDSALRNLTFTFELLYQKAEGQNYERVYTNTLDAEDKDWFEDYCGNRIFLGHIFLDAPKTFEGGAWLYAWQYSGEESGRGGLWEAFTYSLMNEYLLCIAPTPLPPDPTKEGYTFTGWYLDEACTQKYNGTEITEDMTLYAGWKINTYTVRIDRANGSEIETVTADYNTVLNLAVPERAGYEFLGWFIDGGETEFAKDDVVKTDLSLTAKWQRKTVNVTFMVDGEVYKSLKVLYGVSLYDVMAKNGLAYYNVQSVAAQGGIPEDFSKVEDDTVVTIAAQKGFEKLMTYFKTNWIWFATIAGGAVLLIIVAVIAVTTVNKLKATKKMKVKKTR